MNTHTHKYTFATAFAGGDGWQGIYLYVCVSIFIKKNTHTRIHTICTHTQI